MPRVVAVEELIGARRPGLAASWGDCSMVPPGECGTCRQARVVRSARGAVFFLCLRSRTDARYPKYPALPRWGCPGHDPAPPAEALLPREPMPDAELRIRSATADDVPVILRFIERLAEYERLGHEVLATEDDLRATLFGDTPAAEVVIASWQDRDVGFALFFQTYSTFLARPGMHLEDLFVLPDARGAGVGRALLSHLAQLSEARGYGRIEWAVLTWNSPAIGFYEQLGAFPLDEWQTYRLNRDGIRALAVGAAPPTSHHD
jgi:GNAT superfamily N-acetyltransferase